MPENSTNSPMHPLSANAFIRALHGETVVDEKGEEVSFLIDKEIIVENVEVKESIVIDGNYFFGHIIIKSGIFHKEFNFENSIFFDSIIVSGGIFKKEIVIESGLFVSLFNISGGEFQNGFTIYGGCFLDEFFISNGIFIGNFEIIGGIFFKYFNITDAVFQGNFEIGNGIFLNCFEIWGGTFNRYLKIYGGTFKASLNLYGGEFSESLIICEGQLNKLHIQNSNIKKIEIRDLEVFIQEIEIRSEIQNEISINSAQINKLLICKRIKSSGNLYLKKLSLNQLSFESFENEGRISITDVRSGGVLKKDLKTGTIIETPAPSTFQILNSDMGSISFFNMDFDSFDTIIIKDSKLNEIKTINKHLPTSEEKKIYANESKEQNSHFLEKLYNHLYFAMQKQGNRTQEIKYYAEYLEFHRKNKLEKLKGTALIHKIFKQDWYTPLSLWLHKSTSSYGTNWLRAFLCIIGVGAVTYFAYAVSLPEIKFGFRYFTNNNLSFHIRYFFEFLLPVHKMTLIDHTNPTGLSALIDTLGRIFISFLIYQTIAAFRRFGIK